MCQPPHYMCPPATPREAGDNSSGVRSGSGAEMEIDKGIQAIGNSSFLTGPGWMQWAGSWLSGRMDWTWVLKKSEQRPGTGRAATRRAGEMGWIWLDLQQKGWALLHLGQRQECGYTSHTQ